MKYLRWLCGLFCVLVVLAACTPDDEPIPTLARLSTSTYTPQPTMTRQSASELLPPTFTPTDTETPTQTYTPTVASTLTATVTVTPSATITNTPSPTWTPLPTIPPENRPLLALALTAEAATILPTDFVVPPHQGIDVTLAPQQATPLPAGVPSPIPPLGTPTATSAAPAATQSTCADNPPGGFGAVYFNNPDIAAQLGCPVAGAAQDVPAAWQAFQQGVMVWLNGEILVLYNNGQFQSFSDTFIEGVDPQTSSETPPQGLYAPVRGFLKVWSNNPSVRDGLGWALNPEQGVTGKVLAFENGRMVWLPGRGDIFVLLSSRISGTWQAFTGTF